MKLNVASALLTSLIALRRYCCLVKTPCRHAMASLHARFGSTITRVPARSIGVMLPRLVGSRSSTRAAPAIHDCGTHGLRLRRLERRRLPSLLARRAVYYTVATFRSTQAAWRHATCWLRQLRKYDALPSHRTARDLPSAEYLR